MPMPARTVLPAKLAAAEKHMAGWKVHEIWWRAKCFFFGRGAMSGWLSYACSNKAHRQECLLKNPWLLFHMRTDILSRR